MENEAYLLVEFNNYRDLKQFCFYLDSETKPDFEDDVPENEHVLFEKSELLTNPYCKASDNNIFVAYGFEMMEHPNVELQSIFDIAKAFNMVDFTSFWRGEYEEYSLAIKNNDSLEIKYSDEKQPNDEQLKAFLLSNSCKDVIGRFINR